MSDDNLEEFVYSCCWKCAKNLDLKSKGWVILALQSQEKWNGPGFHGFWVCQNCWKEFKDKTFCSFAYVYKAKKNGDNINTIRDKINYKPPHKNPYPYDSFESMMKEIIIAIPDWFHTKLKEMIKKEYKREGRKIIEIKYENDLNTTIGKRQVYNNSKDGNKPSLKGWWWAIGGGLISLSLIIGLIVWLTTRKKKV